MAFMKSLLGSAYGTKRKRRKSKRGRKKGRKKTKTVSARCKFRNGKLIKKSCHRVRRKK